MALYRATIHKVLTATGHKWSNVYTLNCIDAFAAETAVLAVAGYERQVTYDVVHFTYATVVNKANKLDTRTVDISYDGLLHHDTVGQELPLFCTTRVVFSDRTKKPEQKYLRSPGWTDRITTGANWDSDWVTLIQTQYANPLVAMAEFVGPSGERPITATAHPEVQNRQLGWHRRGRPGFKRGWVPR